MSQTHGEITAWYDTAIWQLITSTLCAPPGCILSAYAKCKARPDKFVSNKTKTLGDFNRPNTELERRSFCTTSLSFFFTLTSRPQFITCPSHLSIHIHFHRKHTQNVLVKTIFPFPCNISTVWEDSIISASTLSITNTFMKLSMLNQDLLYILVSL